MSELFDYFCERFRKAFPKLDFQIFHDDSSASLVVKGGSKRFGAITILDDVDELTVELGDHYHEHFSLLSRKDSIESVSDEVIYFVKDIISDKLVLQCQYADEKIVRSKLIDPSKNQFRSETVNICNLFSKFWKKKETVIVSWSGKSIVRPSKQ